jgi:septum formation protein
MTQSQHFRQPKAVTNQLQVILASTSPFRQKILQDAGIPFIAMGAEGDEKTIAGLPPKYLAAKRAEFKGIDVARRAPASSLVIGADQVLGLENRSFDKANSPAEAALRLKELQGKTHILHSAFCLIEVHQAGSCKTVFETVVDVPMPMRTLSDEDINEYVATGEWQGCVGCYRIEGQGKNLFKSITADESAIIGLPLAELRSALQQFTLL